ncbi:FAD-dependent oxidoreductase [Microbacterium yannicii]|uniref:FAD-dependent oxidoreductase n=1 Tax=Microbacterium yannicii TaxID=671622 RepID=UPI0002D921FF|nr:FAD-dependent oxidoreductase [Microbacterium yannicii]
MHIVAIGGSDAGISAALRARELDPTVDVTVVVADAYPNYSICGIPYYFSGDVQPWQSLAHRTHADLEATGMRLRLDTLATRIDVANRRLSVRDAHGDSEIGYDELIVGTGALPAFAGIHGLDALGPECGVHVIHSTGDTFALDQQLKDRDPRTAIIIGAEYVGLEMAEGFASRGIRVTQLQRGPEVLSTLDPELAVVVHTELLDHGVDVHTGTTVKAVEKTATGLVVHAQYAGEPVSHTADLVLAVVGARPNASRLEDAGASVGAFRAVAVDQQMRTGLPHVFAAGDGVITHHRLLGVTYPPLGTTAHKQGRIAGENALGGQARFAGSVGTQVVKVFDVVAARTGLREHEAAAAGYSPATTQAIADDHKRYYPGAQPINIRITGDTHTGLLLGAQLVGRLGTETAKRVDTYATALFAGLTVEQISDLDLSYTPPLGSAWDAVQTATQEWSRARHPVEVPA